MALTLLQQILDNARLFPEERAFVYFDESGNLCSISYLEVLLKVEKCRKYYASFECDRIAIVSTNSVDMICNIWGALATGKTVGLIDPLLEGEEISERASYTDMQLISRSDDISELDSFFLETVPEIEVTGLCKGADESAETDFSCWQEGKVVIYTSGTSASSKGVVCPLTSVLGEREVHERIIYFEQGGLTMMPVPLHHGFGFTMTIFYYGERCPIFVSSMKSLLKDIKKVNPSVIALVPSGAEFLLKKKAFSENVHAVIISGSFCPLELGESIRALGIKVQNRYGSSEINCAIGENLIEDSVDTITVHDYNRVEISSEGEVIIHTPYHFSEYYKRPLETEEVKNGDIIYTGDMGYLDEKGKLHLYGRKKNMILLENGEKLIPEEVENSISLIDGIEENAILYDAGKLIAVIRTNPDVLEEDIRTAINVYNEKRPVSQKIKKLWFYDKAFPYTSTGKLLRRVILDEYRRNIEQTETGSN